MAKAIILLRVSTKYQDYEQQKKELIEYCNSKGYDNYIFIEDKESGKLKEEERLGLNKLKETIVKDSSFKSVFVYEISRLARTEKVLYSMKEFFIDKKINLYIYMISNTNFLTMMEQSIQKQNCYSHCMHILLHKK